MLDRDAVLLKVKAVLAEIVNDEKVLEMPPTTSLKDDLGIDSMNSLVLLMNLEKELEGFEVDVETLDASHFESIGSIRDYVSMQLGL
ncbi:MAG: acyl carrier protein [Kordiimonadaceae bacterium]|nr:acyl carrier protein [Kordiimonadaceae bacterium]